MPHRVTLYSIVFPIIRVGLGTSRETGWCLDDNFWAVNYNPAIRVDFFEYLRHILFKASLDGQVMRKLNHTNITSSHFWKIFNNTNPTEMPHQCAKSPVSKLNLSFTSTKSNSSWKAVAQPGATNGERNMKRCTKMFQLGNPVKNLVALSLPSITLMPNILSCSSLLFFLSDSTIPGRSHLLATVYHIYCLSLCSSLLNNFHLREL